MDTRTEATAASSHDPRTVDEARDAVERSRQRISSTLDQLEDRIVEKKHEIQDRADVLRPVRERIAQRPFTSVAIAIGVGAVLGSLGGGDAGEGGRAAVAGRRSMLVDDEQRRRRREWREARQHRLRARTGHHRSNGAEDTRFDALKQQLLAAVLSAVSTAVTARVREFASGRGGHDGGNAGQRQPSTEFRYQR
jgi:ElaB/YqjD/DUF883 family membrane-anchored ribosome-binding protein